MQGEQDMRIAQAAGPRRDRSRHGGVGVLLAGSVLTAVGGLATPATASTIDWVTWNPSDSNVINGTSSALAVTGNFTAKGNDTWAQANVTITDPTWTFANNQITPWQIRNTGSAYVATGDFDFTNTGGLAAGGSLAILDLEEPDATVGVTGYQWNGSSYNVVAVNWSYSYFTTDVGATPPVWNGTTNVLTGGGQAVGGWSMFSMLTSDVRLDRITFAFNVTAGDGFGIAFTQANVAAVPGAGIAGLATLGLAGISRRRRR